MTVGRGGTTTHDYKRHGTTDLFAAMNVAAVRSSPTPGALTIASNVLAFSKVRDLHVSKDLIVDVVLDSLSAHKAPPVAKWLADPKRA